MGSLWDVLDSVPGYNRLFKGGVQQVAPSVGKVRFDGSDTMIVAYLFVTILCGAFSLPFPQSDSSSRSGSGSVFRFNTKRNARLDSGHVFDYRPGEYGDDLSLEEQIDRGELRKKVDSPTTWEDVFTPKKLWTLHCEPNCPTEYLPDTSGDDNPARLQTDDDILLHLSADKDLMKFLKWTMEHLGPLQGYNASSIYYPGLNTWKKLNLSGRRELPLYVEEPRYIVVRREPDELEPHLRSNPDLPFIPPRGRKYIPNLENLMSRYELFVPNRGKRDKIKDIFKYDDLFFPNRGKKRINSISNGNNCRPRSGGMNGIFGRLYYQLAGNDRKKLHQPFDDCFTRYDDITSAPPPLQPSVAATNQVENINGLVSASTLLLPPPLQVSPSATENSDGHQDTAGCGAGAVAECQKENDVKINGFDQSVKALIHQRQHSKGGAGPVAADSLNDRRLLSSASSASALGSMEAGASSFLPLMRPDQVRRLQPYPIRNKQWRDYYF